MNTDHVSFGPWTTTLHHVSRLELSAFWRRRLDRLGSLATSRPPLNWRTGLTLCLLAGTVLFVPRLRLDTSAKAEEQTALPATAAGAEAKDRPFIAMFSNGVKVELIGLSNHPSKSQPWWAPDGAPLGQAPYSRFSSTAHPSEGELGREICWRWTDTPNDPDFETDWATNPHYDSAAGGTAFDAGGKQVEGITAWAVGIPGSPDVCTMRFSVSIHAAPWSTVWSNTGHNPGATASTIDSVNQGMIFAESVAAGADTTITVSHQIPGKSVRLVAVDKANKTHLASSSPGARALGFSQNTYRFADIHPDQIERFDLQSQQREYETIEFRNVSLHPDKRTKPEVVRLAADQHRERPTAGKAEVLTPTIVLGRDARGQQIFELLELLAREDRYRLNADQRLKRLPPPFSKTRDEFWAVLSSPTPASAMGRRAPGEAEQAPWPGFMVLNWAGNYLVFHSARYGKPTLMDVLDSVFNLKLQEIDADLKLLTTEVPGDWVVSWGSQRDHVTNADEIAALEHILRDEMMLPVRLASRQESRTVYVAKGNYKYTSIAFGRVVDDYFDLPLRRTNISDRNGSYRDFLQSIGEVILTPIVDETETPTTKHDGWDYRDYVWSYGGKSPTNLLAPFDDVEVDGFLASITKQTGLTFSKETRPVKTLFIERDSAPSGG
jgi:hypothetical protein